jgi:hypothetical protein
MMLYNFTLKWSLPVASSCEYGDESSGSGSSATELVSLNYSKMVDVQNSEVSAIL